MKRNLRILLCGLAVVTLAACSHKNANAPLSYVPADTPYLAANLKPMDADMRALAFKQANAQLPMQVSQLRQLAEKLQNDKPHLAAVLRTLADEMNGRTVQQIIKHLGLDADGLSAFYGLGLSPVLRVQLADPSAFNAFITRLEKAWGTPMAEVKLDGVSYRQAAWNGKIRLRFIVAIDHKQAVLALLPDVNDSKLLRMALGLDKPKDSVQSSGRLKKIAGDNGYLPYSLAYLDLTQWPRLIAGQHDPMLKALVAAEPGAGKMMPASCEPDLQRIAARVPMISTGMTALDARHVGYRIRIDLAPDIARAFSGVDVHLPGLGQPSTHPADIAIALPVEDIRSFWTAQAEAVAAKPFTCPSLVGLNDGFVKLRMALLKTALPTINDLRGMRVILDDLAFDKGSLPQISGQALIASNNPEGLLAAAQLALPPLRDLKLAKDGKPVALPASLTGKVGGLPAWAAMTDHVLAIAVGAGEGPKLQQTLKEKQAGKGFLASFHLDGTMYRKLIEKIADTMEESMQNMAVKGKAGAESRQNLEENLQNMKQQAKQIGSINEDVRVDNRGLGIDVSVKRN